MTGFGGTYEQTTQKLFWYAVLIIAKNDYDTLHLKLNDYVQQKKLDVTGAMFGTALIHAWHFLNDGEEKYYGGFSKERIYFSEIEDFVN